VNNGGSAFECLDQVGLQGILEECGHSTLGTDITCKNRFACVCVTDENIPKPRLEITDARCQAQNCHHLGGSSNIKSCLPGHALSRSAQTNHHVTESTIIHIHDPLPGNGPGINAQIAFLRLYVVVNHCRKKVVGFLHGRQITGKMEVYVLHGDHL